MGGEKSTYDFTMNSTDGKSTPLSRYRGLVIVGFSANDFGGPEPATNRGIRAFCSITFKVTLATMAEVPVKGDDKTPPYQFLTDNAADRQTGGEIQSNRNKFLIGFDGHPVAQFEPNLAPDDLQVTATIEKELASRKN